MGLTARYKQEDQETTPTATTDKKKGKRKRAA
jgi:hypothetical protein